MPQRRGLDTTRGAVGSGALVRTRFGGRTRTTSALAALLRVTVRPVIGAWSVNPGLPWPYLVVDYVGRPLRRARGTTARPVALRHCAAELVTPSSSTSGRHILYLHGGAFVVGGRHLHRQLVSHVAQTADATALVVGYRKLPKHSITTAIADCVDGYRHLLASGVAPEQIVFAGDSAGGYLVLMTAVTALREGLPAPAGIVAMSPLTDFDPTHKVSAPTAQTCALFTPTAMHAFAKFARIGGEVVPSPADADLRGLPPTLVQAAEGEILYPDAELVARRLAAAGVACELQTWDNAIHVFQAAAAISREAAQAVALIGAFAQRVAPTAVEQLEVDLVAG